MKVDPFPGMLLAVIVPQWRSTIFLQMASPMPTPSYCSKPQGEPHTSCRVSYYDLKAEAGHHTWMEQFSSRFPSCLSRLFANGCAGRLLLQSPVVEAKVVYTIDRSDYQSGNSRPNTRNMVFTRGTSMGRFLDKFYFKLMHET
jgi:hypothetical protein